MAEPVANTQQGTPSHADLDAQLAAEEASRSQPEAAATETADPVVAAPEEAPADKEPETDPDAAVEKRIARLAYAEREQRKANRALSEEIARLKGAAPPLPANEELERQVEARANQRAAEMAFNEKANQIHKDGLKAYTDFDANLANLREIGGLSNQVIEACAEAGNPAAILQFLGKNVDEAERIFALPAHRMGVALAAIAAKSNAAPAIKAQSKAPPPIKPLGGAAKAEVNEETMAIGDFMKLEDERYRQRGGRNR